MLASGWKKVPIVANLRNSFIQVTVIGKYSNDIGIFGIMSKRLQVTHVNGTLKPNKTVNDISNSIKIAIIILSLAVTPVMYHVPFFQYGIHHARQRFVRYHDFTTEHLFANLDSFVFMGSNRILNKKVNVLNTKPVTAFDPSMKILSRIMNVLIENNAVIKAALLQKANLNHVRLSMHLDWLEQKGFIKYVVIDDKINVTMIETGREFAKPFV